MEETKLCPRCKSDKRLWPKLIEEYKIQLIGEVEPALLKFNRNIAGVDVRVYVDACARCGTLYYYKYTVEGVKP